MNLKIWQFCPYPYDIDMKTHIFWPKISVLTFVNDSGVKRHGLNGLVAFPWSYGTDLWKKITCVWAYKINWVPKKAFWAEIGDFIFFENERGHLGPQKQHACLHLLQMNFFVEKNPRVTYIEKKLEQVTLNFQRVTVTWRHFFLRSGVTTIFFHPP